MGQRRCGSSRPAWSRLVWLLGLLSLLRTSNADVKYSFKGVAGRRQTDASILEQSLKAMLKRVSSVA